MEIATVLREIENFHSGRFQCFGEDFFYDNEWQVPHAMRRRQNLFRLGTDGTFLVSFPREINATVNTVRAGSRGNGGKRARPKAEPKRNYFSS